MTAAAKAFGRSYTMFPEVSESCEDVQNCSWSESIVQQHIAVVSYRYCYPAISVAGVLGSLLLLLTLRHACFHKAGVYTYLRCLMVSDCAVLAMAGTTFLVDSWQPNVVCAGRTMVLRSRAQAVWRVIFLPVGNGLIVFGLGVSFWMTYDRYRAVRTPHELWRHPQPAQEDRNRLLRIIATLLVSLLLHAPQVLGYEVVHHCPASFSDFYEPTLTKGASTSWLWSCYQWSLQLLVRWLPTGFVLYCNSYIIMAIKRREHRMSANNSAMSRLGPDEVTERVSERVFSSSQPRTSWLVSEGASTPSQAAASGSSVAVQRRHRRRQEVENRLEFLLAAMAASYLVANFR